MKKICLQCYTPRSGKAVLQQQTDLQPDRAEVREHSHAAAGGDLASVSEPCDLGRGEAMDLRRLDERALTLGHRLRPLALYKPAHIWQKEKQKEEEGEAKTSILDGKVSALRASRGDKEEELSLLPS